MEILFLSVTGLRQDSIYIYIFIFIFIFIYSHTTIIIILMTTTMIQQGKDFNENSIYTYEGDFFIIEGYTIHNWMRKIQQERITMIINDQ